mmetsp:Transcript_54710/g.90565  ORF Transcript_54710/g.90565 Transcript_54710/m.90565 type:complete len:94 (+) Transcript_54710:454-735(+)
MERETFLTSAVQWLEDDMQQFQTLWDEVKELKLDQALAQANLDRRLQDLEAFQRQDRCAEEMLGTISLDLHKKKASTSVGPSAAPQKQSGRQY